MDSLTIIGHSKVGTAFWRLAKQRGLNGVLLPARDLPQNLSLAGTVLLAVPDDRIRDVCDKLIRQSTIAEGTVVAHCSGALTSEVLSSASKVGCHTGSIHPLQTFPTTDAAVERLPSTFAFVEGDEIAVAALTRLGKLVTRDVIRISRDCKALYHVAAVMSCNYLCALLHSAFAVARQSGIPAEEAQTVLLPLIRSTIDNIENLGSVKALTGPIARGDLGTVVKHVQALEDQMPELVELFCVLGRVTADLARQGQNISVKQHQECLALLETAQGRQL